MKLVLKRIICLAVAAALLAAGGVFLAGADSNAISVKKALTGELLYSGNDLQEAFEAAESGSVVSIGSYNVKELTADVVLDKEIMLDGYNYLKNKFGDYKILLTGNGAIYVDTRIRTKYIGALYSYSTVDVKDAKEVTELYEGWIYYLLTEAPSLEGKTPVVDTKSGGVYGARVDEENGIVYLDGAAGGLTTDVLAKLVTMDAVNADGVDVTFQNTVLVDGKACVTNGTTMILTAANYDYASKVFKTYKLIVLGDVNCNGRIDSADASMMVRCAGGTLEITGDALIAADADCDGFITEADAYRICKKYVRGSSYSSALQQ